MTPKSLDRKAGRRIDSAAMRTSLAVRFLVASFVILAIAACAVAPASAAGSAKVALAPVSALTAPDEVKGLLPVLPRLLASRLTAASGAEVILLPAGGVSVDAAKSAGASILVETTVTKVGKGYSIDASATDLASGAPAGAFFVEAATEDEIIPKLGELSAQMAEKLLGARPTARPVAQAPVAAPAAPVAVAPVVPTVPASSIPGITYAPAAPATTAVSTIPGISYAQPAGSTGGPVTMSMRKVSTSDPFVDEFLGLVVGDSDANGDGEVIAFGPRTLYIHKVKGAELLPYTRIVRPTQDHILSVEAFDLDVDGKKDLLVTMISNDRIWTIVYLRRGDTFQELPSAKVGALMGVLHDLNGKAVVVGQTPGFDNPYSEKIDIYKWDGKTLVVDGQLPADVHLNPLAAGGLPGLSACVLGGDQRLLYVDEKFRLRILETTGKPLTKSKEFYNWVGDYFEWGPHQFSEGGKRKFYLRRPFRPFKAAGQTLFLAVNVKEPSAVDRMSAGNPASRVVVLRWDGTEMVEVGATPFTEYLSAGAGILPAGRGGKVVSAVVEEPPGLLRTARSRLVLHTLE